MGRIFEVACVIVFQIVLFVDFGASATRLFTNETSVRGRILGGVPAQLGELKYQLSLRYLGLHRCGASLVQLENLQFALTAASCVFGTQPEDVSLVAGDVRLSERFGTEQERQVSKIVSHENFSYPLKPYDIGVIFFNQPFVLNDFVGTIPLPTPFLETNGTLVVSGWGVYNKEGFISDNLTKVEIPVVDQETCRISYAGLVNKFYSHYLCAGIPGARKNSCKGDSGGPLRSLDGGYLAGIISWGVGCFPYHPKYPYGVNTKVSYFTDWIREEVKKHKGDGGGGPKEEDESEEDYER